jgi:hypothetical protein
MPVGVQISILIYMIVQGALFGVGVVVVLATPLSTFAMQILPWVIGVTALVSIPVSYMIARVCSGGSRGVPPHRPHQAFIGKFGALFVAFNV